MSIDAIVVLAVSGFGIGFTYWFFLMKKDEKAVAVTGDTITITVEGGYTPQNITVTKNNTTTLNFFRKDPSSCLEEVVLPDFKVRKYLPLKKTTAIVITPTKSGVFEISCGMNMFHGKITVV